jgi:hypothetical protein
MIKFFRYLYYVVRYGEWDIGWKMWPGKPMLEFCHDYYDGNWYSIHIWKFYISCYC